MITFCLVRRGEHLVFPNNKAELFPEKKGRIYSNLKRVETNSAELHTTRFDQTLVIGFMPMFLTRIIDNCSRAKAKYSTDNDILKSIARRSIILVLSYNPLHKFLPDSSKNSFSRLLSTLPIIEHRIRLTEN